MAHGTTRPNGAKPRGCRHRRPQNHFGTPSGAPKRADEGRSPARTACCRRTAPPQGKGGARGRGPFAEAVAPALLGQSRVGLAEHGASLLFRLLPFSPVLRLVFCRNDVPGCGSPRPADIKGYKLVIRAGFPPGLQLGFRTVGLSPAPGQCWPRGDARSILPTLQTGFGAPSPPMLSIFHRSADPEPRPGRSCLPLNYFTRSIYLQGICQGPFKP